MNYGYVDLDPGAKPLELAESDEPDRLCIQLYHRVAGAIDLANRDVLEVGCGRGGGSSYIMRYLRPRSVVGMDISQQAVDLCTRHRSVPGLTFVQGDAEALPFPEATFDVVINVESSHCYGSMDRFLSEVHRVLRPGGHLLFADLRGAGAMEELRTQLESCPLRLVEEDMIAANVFAALEQDSERKVALIRQMILRVLRRPFLPFAAIRGSTTYESFRNGEMQYLSCILRKSRS
jgi:SAM-dependent methyltransferase